MTGRPRRTTEGQLVDAAAALIVDHGVAGTRIGLVADACGVSVGTVYNHFASKDHLLLAVAHDVEQRFVRAMEQAAPSSTSLRTALPNLVDALLQLAGHTPTARLLTELAGVHGSGSDPDGVRIRAWIARRVRLAQEAGEVGPASPDVLADLAYAVVSAGLRRAGGPVDEPDLAPALVRALDELLPGPPSVTSRHS